MRPINRQALSSDFGIHAPDADGAGHGPEAAPPEKSCCRKKANHRLIAFQGYSMYPFLRNGDRLVVRTEPIVSPGIGDIVTLPINGNGKPPAFIAHRIVSKTADGKIITKGDNMKMPDRPILAPADIAGVVVFVLRRRRLKSLTGVWSRCMAHTIAALSRWNLTPAIVAGYLKNRV